MRREVGRGTLEVGNQLANKPNDMPRVLYRTRGSETRGHEFPVLAQLIQDLDLQDADLP